MFGDSGHLRHSAVLRTLPLRSLNSCGSLRSPKCYRQTYISPGYYLTIIGGGTSHTRQPLSEMPKTAKLKTRRNENYA